jgi:thiol-disulfide isomerase/thioredoxin
MSTSTRWTLAVLAVIAALVVALAFQLTDDPVQPTGGSSTEAERNHRDADTPEALAGPRQRADLPPCPADGSGPGPAKLRGIVVDCAADGSQVEVARALAGRTVVLNLWAYWCAPCADELPALAQYQRRAGDAVTVVTVHQDENEMAGLARVLAVDIPSGMDCDTGGRPGACVRADATATFVAAKAGFERAGAAAYTGSVHVLGIGAPRELLARFGLTPVRGPGTSSPAHP